MARPRAVTRLLIVAWLAACGPRAPAPPLGQRAPQRPAVVLVVARAAGLFEITAAGRDVRRLSATPAQHPRWVVPGHRLVFLTRDAAELRSLDLDAGAERVVARVRPRIACPGEPPPAELQPRENLDVAVKGTRACVHLADHHAMMARYSVDVHVDLATGRTEDYVIAPDACHLPRRTAPDACLGGPMVGLPGIGDDPVPPAGPAGLQPFARSPSGRWVVLRGNLEVGDWVYTQVVLHERATRRTFPLVGDRAPGADGWPAPLTAQEVALDAGALGAIVGHVVSETAIFWIPGADDRLVVDETLVIPGVRAVPIGQLAF